MKAHCLLMQRQRNCLLRARIKSWTNCYGSCEPLSDMTTSRILTVLVTRDVTINVGFHAAEDHAALCNQSTALTNQATSMIEQIDVR